MFLLAAFFAYWLIAARIQPRIVFLLAASYGFYLASGWQALALLFAISTIDYCVTRLMQSSERPRTRKLLLAVSLTTDVGVLCVFKYANFFLSNAASVFGWHAPALRLLVPLGLSFFIFQSVAYVIDSYRRTAEPAKTYFEYLAFIAFFPTLVAGPILRASQFLPQLRQPLALSAEQGGQALALIALGLLKKIAVADYLSVNLVERVFDFPERYSSLEVLLGVYGYALQIYADFSGYSDIAIGSALLLGFTLPENFNLPYRAVDLPDFWRRWHISLSTWLRDYVFFSLAGKRLRNVKMLYAASLVTMLIGGLWHGAAWPFVIWGLLHGIGLIVVRWWQSQKTFAQTFRASLGATVISMFLTFHFVCLTWIFFRAETLAQAVGIVRQIARGSVDVTNLNASLLILIAGGLLMHWLPQGIWTTTQRGFTRLPAPAQALLLFGLGIGLYAIASSEVAPFIYARF
ncbi:MAG: MBOAT family protein [Acidobacteria bacterium]|nr:MBOAT family protein [Acidobacteriota bacterium]